MNKMSHPVTCGTAFLKAVSDSQMTIAVPSSLPRFLAEAILKTSPGTSLRGSLLPLGPSQSSNTFQVSPLPS